MLNIVTFIKALISTIGAFFEWKHDEALRQDGANKADLEGRKAADEVANAIDTARADSKLRDTIKDKYTRD
jgi:hypothetical protein